MSRHTLTPREREVAAYAAQGLSDLNIGAILGLSENTVGSHLVHIFRKLRISDRSELAVRLGRGALTDEVGERG